ncbi:MAG: TraR/DksA family transcriptional regulator [Humidesulfovibrio sp.]|nr:TraR/DksA family transcriptional regulator [Humidesulfovibrio sp.]
MQGTLRKQLLNTLSGLTPPICPDADMDDTPRLDACADENEYASRVVEVGMQLALRRRMEARRGEIEDALARMDTGVYGVCEDCGDDIGMARLLATPTARLCVHCQSERETAQYLRCA